MLGDKESERNGKTKVTKDTKPLKQDMHYALMKQSKVCNYKKHERRRHTPKRKCLES